MMFISATLERNWEENSANTGKMQKKIQNNKELAAQIHKYRKDFDKDIDVLVLKGNLHQKHEKELWEDKLICYWAQKRLIDLI